MKWKTNKYNKINKAKSCFLKVISPMKIDKYCQDLFKRKEKVQIIDEMENRTSLQKIRDLKNRRLS